MKLTTMRSIVALTFMALSAGPVLAISATDVVPVDISMIQLEGGKGIAFQNTFAQPFYVYDRDAPGRSNCNDKCAETWIPVYTTDREAKDMLRLYGVKFSVDTRGYMHAAHNATSSLMPTQDT